MPILCIPIREKTFREVRKKIKIAEKKADVLEIWLDQFPDIDPFEFKKITHKPLLFVNKGKYEKGCWKGSEETRIARLVAIIPSKPSYLDIGIHTATNLVKKIFAARKKLSPKTKIILSFHHFKKTPPLSTLWKIVQKARKLDADIVKIATTAQTAKDNLIIFNLLLKACTANIPLIALCMGKYGRPSRFFGADFGSHLTYVALDKKSKTAPGQLTVEEMPESLFDLYGEAI